MKKRHERSEQIYSQARTRQTADYLPHQGQRLSQVPLLMYNHQELGVYSYSIPDMCAMVTSKVLQSEEKMSDAFTPSRPRPDDIGHQFNLLYLSLS